MLPSTTKGSASKSQAPQTASPSPKRASVIAIDGPVAAGKTTVGRALAARLGYRFLDTGLMYRAVTWLAIQQGISVEDAQGLAALARRLDFQVTVPTGAEGEKVLVGGVDVTLVVRTPEVEAWVSHVSAIAGVRQALVAQQRALAAEGKMVMVGRDIGTNVLPDAPLKVYLDASAEERAGRRHRERQARGERVDLAQARRELERRDALDMGREVAPLRAAEDARLVLTNGLSVEEVTQLILDLAVAPTGAG